MKDEMLPPHAAARRIAELEAREEECKSALPRWVQGPGLVGAILHMAERIAALEAEVDELAQGAREGATTEQRAQLARIDALARRYRERPIDTRDDPDSWQRLEDLLMAIEGES